MLKHSTRRWLAGLGVAGAFVAASATPAAAEPGSDDILLYANNALIAVGGEDKYIELSAFAEVMPKDVTITVNRGAVTDFASVVLSDDVTGCTETATVITCNVKGSRLIDDSLVLRVTAKDKAVAGAKGDVVLSVGAKGGPATTTRASVEVGEGVDLRAQDLLEAAGAPGTTVKTPLGVANIGDTTTRGTVLFMANTQALAPAQRYSNCSYAEGFGYLLTVCRFDDEIPAGVALRLDGSAGLKIASDAWAPSVQGGSAFWFASGDYEEFARQQLPEDGWQKGNGSALTLVPAPAAQARSLRQTDKDTSNNSTLVHLRVTGDQRADLVATGAELPGTIGKTVTAKVGFVNNGPARTNGYTTGEIITATKVTVPEGATVVNAPENCAPTKGDKPAGEHGDEGGRVYFCEWYDVVRKGQSAVFEFGLRIDKVGGAAGSVQLVHFDVAEEKQTIDLNPKNDIAPLVIEADGGNGGGDGGPLPITGASTGLIAGLGGLLLAAGAGGYLAARRRRTRFVA
ncbi:LPXTG cell wall anchor domain-containing protein [Micromonospora sp. KC606]|uniref:LPXTG cell wall anchor domain-containing protein n=1 Tax=Micromonospora sp. KC606 TaxID=2530379 RepID=UPI00104F5965|nr:LPXTG cell wall anchor domain-containing protein [Micromonospora sp. KC606]TDC76923.1 LPXTG cell wall anchor domain-containing protein [Micromonospora sp. KC606]